MIDSYLNRITMYRLVLYILVALVLIAALLGIIGLTPYSPVSILLSTGFIALICVVTNNLFAKVYNAPANTESAYITALILALIVSPARSAGGIVFLVWVAVLAMASKYILALGRKHLFNPAAIAVVLTAIGWGQTANWWVGNIYMALPVAIGGYLIMRKTRREDMVWNFLLTVLSVSIGLSFLKSSNFVTTINTLIFHSSLLFFAGVMLTEPLTSPTTKKWQGLFGIFTGLLFIPQVHIGSIYSTPELALIVANIFAFVVSPKEKLLLQLKEKIKISPDTYDFIFPISVPLHYQPGQYMEWTLGHDSPDSRGNRRYFTLASSPTENNLRIGVKFYSPASSYKQKMLLDENSHIVASQLAGDFTLPRNPDQKCVFMAGGIGVTPFRSMLKYLVDTKQRRNIVLLFANKNPGEIIYHDVFDQAERELGIKTVYTLTDRETVPADWSGQVGRVDEQMILREIPDYRERIFYLSGPQAMVTGDETLLQKMGVKKEFIKTDFFPGFA